jgi:hypothetical protein
MRRRHVSTSGLTRPGDSETSPTTNFRPSCELGVDRSPVLIGSIVASESSGGRLGNYADAAAPRLVRRCPRLIERHPQPISSPYIFPRCHPKSYRPARTPGPRTSRGAHRTYGARDGGHDIGRPEQASQVAGTSDASYDLRSQASSVFSLDRVFPGRIYERPVGQHIRAGRKLRGIDLTAPHDMHDWNATPRAKR